MSPGRGAGGSAECTKGSGLHWGMLVIGTAAELKVVREGGKGQEESLLPPPAHTLGYHSF